MSTLEERVAALEAANADNQLPASMAVLKRKLEQDWQPNASILLEPGSITSAMLPFQVVRGAVSAAGAVLRGAGFTAVRNSIGSYTVTYSTAFASTPVVTFGQGATAVIVFIRATAESASSFTIATYTNAGANTDTIFSFHAHSVEG